MKKFFKLLQLSLLFTIFPLNVLGYSDYIIPGGDSIGIEIKSKGILVVGFYKVDGKLNKGNPKLKVGDEITEVAGQTINTTEELVTAIEKYMTNDRVELTFMRNDKEYTTTLDLFNDDGTFKTGLYVKDSLTGIGTLTYIDPETNIYGALGHEIVESNSNKKVEVRTGTIFRSSVTSIDRSTPGTPGGKNAKFYSSTIYGNVTKNLETGIFGIYSGNLTGRTTLEVGSLDEVETGTAYIYTVLDGETSEKYEINITKIDKKSDIKNIYFDVVDEALLEKTGGIIQGMSGSPIIQNDKIIGAVTHVIVSNPSSGYGISIVKMLENGEK